MNIKNTSIKPMSGISRSPEDFKRLGLKPGNKPEPWEDGFRTNGEKGTYEWWYFDAHLDDGSTIVIIFFPKPVTPLNKPLSPYINIEFDRPDGTSYKKDIYFDAEAFSASKEQCDVSIGENYFRGDLEHYEIHVKDENIELNLNIERTTESWRADTGHQFFDEKKKIFGAWLVPVPQGKVEGRISFQGQSEQIQGSCYHDHNWGTVNMLKVRNHWYWARTEIGPYTVVVADLIGEKEYGYQNTINFYLAKSGKCIADNRDKVDPYRSAPKLQEPFGKPMSDNLKYIYGCSSDDEHYVLTLKKDHNLTALDLMEKVIHNRYLRAVVKMASGINTAYYRIVGEATLEVYQKGHLIKEYKTEKAIWELMYFGDPVGSR